MDGVIGERGGGKRSVVDEDGRGGKETCEILGYAGWILLLFFFSVSSSYSFLWAVDTTLVLCYTIVFVREGFDRIGGRSGVGGRYSAWCEMNEW